MASGGNKIHQQVYGIVSYFLPPDELVGVVVGVSLLNHLELVGVVVGVSLLNHLLLVELEVELEVVVVGTVLVAALTESRK